jgi:hypothetical protein
MKAIIIDEQNNSAPIELSGERQRENVWCEKFAYFIDLEACKVRSLNRSACRRCYKSLIQLSLPFEKK